MSLVLLSSDGPVRSIVLNAPERLNALDRPLLDELAEAIATIGADPEARAVVVTGSGRAFSSGADLENLFGDRTRPPAVLEQVLRDVYASFLGLRDLTIPTIAAVHGPAVGAGLNIALACDVIVAGPKAGFGPTFSTIGLHPGGGCTWLLTQRIGSANTLAALYSGAIIDAVEGHRLGIAQEIADDAVGRATALAHDLAAREPQVMAAIKQTTRVAAGGSLEDTIAAEVRAQAASLTTDTFEAFAARFARR